MPVRSILVPTNGAEAARPALEAAFSIARDVRAHIDVLHVRPDPRDAVPILGEGVSGALIEEIMDVADKESHDRSARARAMFDTCAGKYNLPPAAAPAPGQASVTWLEETGREDEVVTMRGRTTDLIALSRPTPDTDIAATMTLNAALFDTGRPVLVAPPGFNGGPIGTRIAISWNGSAEASRSIASAMPIIEKAKEVVILTAVGEAPHAPAVPEMVNYLAWHGVRASTHNLSSVNKIEGEVLLHDCVEIGADLLVMGAYTRNRLRQMILGGVTRHVLESAMIPLWMAR